MYSGYQLGFQTQWLLCLSPGTLVETEAFFNAVLFTLRLVQKRCFLNSKAFLGWVAFCSPRMFALHPTGSLGLGDELESRPGSEDGTLTRTMDGVRMGETKRGVGSATGEGKPHQEDEMVCEGVSCKVMHCPELLGKATWFLVVSAVGR